MDAKSAWKKFESTGMISDYLNYRLQLDLENGLLPHDPNDSLRVKKSSIRGIKYADRTDGNNNKRNRS